MDQLVLGYAAIVIISMCVFVPVFQDKDGICSLFQLIVKQIKQIKLD